MIDALFREPATAKAFFSRLSIQPSAGGCLSDVLRLSSPRRESRGCPSGSTGNGAQSSYSPWRNVRSRNSDTITSPTAPHEPITSA